MSTDTVLHTPFVKVPTAFILSYNVYNYSVWAFTCMLEHFLKTSKEDLL